MAGLRQHGGAVDVTANTDLEKDVPVYIAGFHGFTLDRAEEDEQVAIDTSESIWEFEVGASVTAALGATLYITTDGTHEVSATSGEGNVPFAKVTLAKDANNIVWAKQLPQVA